MSRPFAAGDQVLLVDAKKRRGETKRARRRPDSD